MSEIDDILRDNPEMYILGAYPKKASQLLGDAYEEALDAMWMAVRGDTVVFSKTLEDMIKKLAEEGIK